MTIRITDDALAMKDAASEQFDRLLDRLSIVQMRNRLGISESDAPDGIVNKADVRVALEKIASVMTLERGSM